MKFRIYFLIVLVLLAGNSLAQSSERVAVIVNKNNTSAITAADIRNMYNDVVTHWPNQQPIVMYDIPTRKKAREVFSKKILGVNASQAARAWANRKITNTAKNPPKTTKEELVPKLVSKNSNAIGYVSEDVAKGKTGIKIIMVLE